MRAMIAALSLPLLSLAACGGGGQTNSLGSIAPPAAGGAGSAGSGNSGTAQPANLLDVSTTKTMDALGSFQSLSIDPDTGAQLYQGNASTATTPSGTITYSPRDGIFTITINDTKAGVSRDVRFQDPAHRTADPAHEVPSLAGYNYLAAADGDNGSSSTFFYQRPGSTTKWVTLGGFVHITLDDKHNVIETEHGAMVFGDATPAMQIPIKGSGHYDGDFLATMVDQVGGSYPAFQWIHGTSSVDVDFGTSEVALALNGVVGPAYVNDTAVSDLSLNIPSGSAFTATGSATIQSLGAGFSGKFSKASFGVAGTDIPIDFASVNPNTSTAGASSIDGRFYGPDADEVGGNFRIIGGVPDQRVDIHGAFTGAVK